MTRARVVLLTHGVSEHSARVRIAHGTQVDPAFCRILLGYPNEEEREGEDVKAAQVTQSGSGEPTVMHDEADTAKATQQRVGETVKMRIRARIALAILEVAEGLDHASAIVDRLDGAYIHDDDWDEEGLPWLSWGREEGSYAGR